MTFEEECIRKMNMFDNLAKEDKGQVQIIKMAQISRHFFTPLFSFATESYIYGTDFILQNYIKS